MRRHYDKLLPFVAAIRMTGMTGRTCICRDAIYAMLPVTAVFVTPIRMTGVAGRAIVCRITEHAML